MSITQRPAFEADSDFLYALHRAALGNVIEATWGPWDDSTQQGFHNDRFDPSRISVVLVEGEPAGVVDAYQSSGNTLYVARIELLPAAQGHGCGTRLLHQLLRQAREAGLEAVELDVLQVNRGACRLYERLGFRVAREAAPKQRMRLDLV